MAELKPCPFCGSTDIKLYAFDIAPECSIECQKCGATIQSEVRWKEKESIVKHDERCLKKLTKKWNRRKKVARDDKC